MNGQKCPHTEQLYTIGKANTRKIDTGVKHLYAGGNKIRAVHGEACTRPAAVPKRKHAGYI